MRYDVYPLTGVENFIWIQVHNGPKAANEDTMVNDPGSGRFHKPV